MPRKRQRQVKTTATASFTLYSASALQAAPDCIWAAQNLHAVINRLANLASPKGRQALANITGQILRLQQAMQTEKAAAADIKVNADLLSQYWSPQAVNVTVAHPLAVDLMRLLADYDDLSLKWATRFLAAPGLEAWYFDKTSQWVAAFKNLAKTVRIYWKPFQDKGRQKTPARKPGPDISGKKQEGKEGEERHA